MGRGGNRVCIRVVEGSYSKFNISAHNLSKRAGKAGGRARREISCLQCHCSTSFYYYILFFLVTSHIMLIRVITDHALRRLAKRRERYRIFRDLTKRS